MQEDIHINRIYELIQSKYSAYISKTDVNFIVIKIKEEHMHTLKNKLIETLSVTNSDIRIFKLGSEQQVGIYKIFHKINSEMDIKKIIGILGDNK